MRPAEKALDDDVTKYHLEPGILAFQGRHRQLLLLSFHRLMASSTRALAVSLERVATRLRRMLGGKETPESDQIDSQSLLGDLEDDSVLPLDAPTDDEESPPNPHALNS